MSFSPTRASAAGNSFAGRRAAVPIGDRRSTGTASDLIGKSKAVKWDNHTFHGPSWVDSNADTALKFYYFLAWEKAIAGAATQVETKLNAFASRFAVRATVKKEVLHLTRQLLDPDVPVSKLDDASIFKFSDGLVLSARGKQAPEVLTNHVEDAHKNKVMDVNVRARARSVAARLTVAASAGGIMASSCPLFTATVLIPLPLIVTGDFKVVKEKVCADLVAKPGELVVHLTNLAGGKMPHIGVFCEERSDLFVTADTERLRQRFQDWVRAIQFDLMVPKIKSTFVGHLLESTLHEDLQKCKQTRYNIKKCIFETLTADQFYEDFLIRMNTLTDITGSNLANVFFAKHADATRMAMESLHGFKLPPRPVGETIDQAYARVALVQEMAVQA